MDQPNTFGVSELSDETLAMWEARNGDLSDATLACLAYRSLRSERDRLRAEVAKLTGELQDRAADKMPHSFVKMRWACGHEAGTACVECKQAGDTERDALRTLLTQLAGALRDGEAFIAGAQPLLARDRDEAVNEILPRMRAALAAAGKLTAPG